MGQSIGLGWSMALRRGRGRAQCSALCGVGVCGVGVCGVGVCGVGVCMRGASEPRLGSRHSGTPSCPNPNPSPNPSPSPDPNQAMCTPVEGRCEPRNWWYNLGIQVLNVLFTYGVLVPMMPSNPSPTPRTPSPTPNPEPYPASLALPRSPSYTPYP